MTHFALDDELLDAQAKLAEAPFIDGELKLTAPPLELGSKEELANAVLYQSSPATP